MARISQIELARKLQVNRSSVSRAVKNGRLTVGKDGLLDEDEARRQWYATQSPLPHHQANRARLDELQNVKAQPENLNLSESDLAIAEKIRLRSNLANMKNMEHKAEQAAINLDKQAGALVELGEVNYVLTDIGRVIVEKVGSLADRYASSLAAHKGDPAGLHKGLDDAAHDILNEISDHLRLSAERVVSE